MSINDVTKFFSSSALKIKFVFICKVLDKSVHGFRCKALWEGNSEAYWDKTGSVNISDYGSRVKSSSKLRWPSAKVVNLASVLQV